MHVTHTGTRMRAAVAIAVAALMASGCTQISHNSGGAQSSADSASPVRGGTLTVGRVPDIVSTDGDVIGAANDDISNNVYDTLIKYDEKLQPQPDLATSWSFNKDDTELTLHLRQQVTFQNGKPFTSADVKYSIEHVRDPKLGSPQLASMSQWITTIGTPDASTVVLTLNQPHPNILDFLDYLCIEDEQTITGPNAKTTANGTGPFELASWKPGIEVVLKRNPKYWNKSEPLLDEIDLNMVGDAQSLLTGLQGGTIDVGENVPPQQAATLSGNNYRVITDTYQNYYIAANVKNPQLADKRVRQAISYAIDRKRFVSDVLAGKATASDTFWTPDSPGYDARQAAANSFDLSKAKQLLADAGVSNLNLNLVTNAGQPDLTGLAQILQADLASIGVKLTIDNLQVPQWRAQAFSGSYAGLISGPYGFNNISCQSLFALSQTLQPSGNFSNFSDPAYTKLVDEAAQATSATQAKDLCNQIATYLQDQAFLIPVSTDPSLQVSRSTVHQLATAVSGGLYFATTFVTK